MSTVALEGNYNGMSSEYVTVADGMRRVFHNSAVRVAKGSNIWLDERNNCMGFANLLSDGIAYAKEADTTVLVLGLDCNIEGEELPFENDYFDGGDRKKLMLPPAQIKLAEAVCDVCDNVIVVVLAGSAVELGDKITERARAIIHGWYPGAVGGLAVARLIAGRFCPSGKLPVTFYRSTEDLPDYTDYSMINRTYRYFQGTPRYPFGYGLSYTSFAYSDASITEESADSYTLTVTLENTGKMDGLEKVQVYASYTDSRTPTPLFQLCGLQAVKLGAGERTIVTISVNKYWLKAVLGDGSRVTPDGEITLYVGGHQPDATSCSLLGNVLTVKLPD
jgi:beta-glucosidase